MQWLSYLLIVVPKSETFIQTGKNSIYFGYEIYSLSVCCMIFSVWKINQPFVLTMLSFPWFLCLGLLGTIWPIVFTTLNFTDFMQVIFSLTHLCSDLITTIPSSWWFPSLFGCSGFPDICILWSYFSCGSPYLSKMPFEEEAIGIR